MWSSSCLVAFSGSWDGLPGAWNMMCFCEAAWQGVEVFSCEIGWLGAAVVHRVVKLLGGIGQLVPSCTEVIARVLAV